MGNSNKIELPTVGMKMEAFFKFPSYLTLHLNFVLKPLHH